MESTNRIYQISKNILNICYYQKICTYEIFVFSAFTKNITKDINHSFEKIRKDY